MVCRSRKGFSRFLFDKTPRLCCNNFMAKLQWLLSSFILSSVAHATITSITAAPVGSSFYTSSGTTTAPIYNLGSTAAIANISGGCSTVCDSCAAQSFQFGTTTQNSNYTTTLGPLCSVKEFSPNEYINITLNATPTTAITTGTIYYMVEVGSTFLSSSLFTVSSTPTTLATTPISLTFKVQLSDICGNSSYGISDCLGSFTTNVTVGWGTSNNTFTESGAITLNHRYVASQTSTSTTVPATSPWATWKTGPSITDYEGFYYFTAFPGDSKVYITNPTAYTAESNYVPDLSLTASLSNNYPTTRDASGMTYTGIRVYYNLTSSSTVGSFTVAGTGTAGVTGYQDLTYSGGNLSPSFVSGLQNLSGSNEYQIVIASIDEAGILSFFTNPDSTSPVMNFGLTPTGSTQAAQPQAVYGVLDGKGCMVATAAYGSALAPQIEILREFRGRYLMRSDWGRKFVSWYYRNSPTWAIAISNSETLKIVVRGFLWPVVGWSALALRWGLMVTLLSTIMLSAPLIFLGFKFFLKKNFRKLFVKSEKVNR